MGPAGAGDPDERLQPDADREPGVVSAESLLDAEFLRVVSPALAEGVRVQRPPYLGGRPPDGPAVREMAGSDLVHRDARQRGRAEDLQPLLDRKSTRLNSSHANIS